MNGVHMDRIHNGGGDNNPTIGYGFNLNAFTYDQIETFLTHALGGQLTALQEEALVSRFISNRTARFLLSN